MSAFVRKCDDVSDDDEDEDCTTVIKRSYSADWLQNAESPINTDDDEDSDAEFMVHPCLRSLIKSKSAYAVPKQQLNIATTIKPSKTSFEISLSKMIESTTKSIAQEAEYSVADLLPSLDQKWPDPEDEDLPKKKKKKSSSAMTRYSPTISTSSDDLSLILDDPHNSKNHRSTECWSCPHLDDDSSYRCASPLNQKCWSSPDLNFEDITPLHPSEVENPEVETNLAYLRPPALREIADSPGYPAIDTPDNDPSVCSYRLPSSIGSAYSPSPPRPLSPVFGRPAPTAYRSYLQQSRSMNLPHRPDIAAFLANANDDVTMTPMATTNFSIGSSEEDDEDEDEEDEEDERCWVKRTEEVWPVEGTARDGWTDAEGRSVHRSATFQINRYVETDPPPAIRISRSANFEMYNWGAESSDEGENRIPEEREREEAENRRMERDEDGENRLIGSEHSQLDDTERRALVTRQAWMQRGSIVCLGSVSDASIRNRLHPEVLDGGVHQNGIQSQYGSFSSLAQSGCEPSTSMRRSCTTDEFRRTRRRLPRRPDEMTIPVDLPQSKSMYERAICAQFGASRSFINAPSHSDNYTLFEDERCAPKTLALQQTTIDTIIQNNRNSMDSRRSMGCNDPCAHLETPISPHAVLPTLPSPSPSSSGRRLPPLPIHSAVLLRRIPPSMSHPNQPAPQKLQDHTLCFMDGMTDSMMERSGIGGMEDSYYEEDGINGNRRRRQAGRKSFFSPDDSSGVSSCTTSDSQNPTHRVQSAFHPRHADELLLEIGDAVHLDRTSDDHWSYGTNLRTGLCGIFPASVVCEIDLVEEICLGALPSNTTKIMSAERDTFYLTMLASIEVAHHKGNDVLVQAMNKVLSMYKNSEEIIVPQTVLMEISFRGIHVIDKRRKNFFQCPMFDFFYSLQNISFCGAHPKQLKYFGFITKHPLLPRFACHVFMSSTTTQPIVEAIGRAFKRSYDEYMAFAHPTEDIYLE